MTTAALAPVSGRVGLPPLERSPLARIAADWRLPALVALAGAFIGEAALRSDRLAFAAAAMVVYAAVVLAWPTVGVLVMVAVAPVASGTARGLLVPRLRLSEAIIFGTAALVLTTAGARRDNRWRVVDWLSLGYVAATLLLGLIDMQVRSEPFNSDTYSKLFGPLEFLLLYRTVVVGLPTPVLRRLALRVLLIVSVPVSLLAISQWLGSLRVEHFLVRITQSPSVIAGFSFSNRRATGPFETWHPLAGYLFLLVVLAVALLFQPNQRVLRRRWLVGIIVVDMFALLTTLTIVSVLGAVVSLIVIAVRTRRVREFLVAFAVIGLLVGVVARPAIETRLHGQFYAPKVGSSVNPHHSLVPQTVYYRIKIWNDQYIPAIKNRLVSGYGPGIPPGVTWSSPESLYLGLLLRGGIPLLGVYLFWLAAVFRRGRRAEQDEQSPEIQAVGLTLTTVIPVMTVMQTIEPYFLNSGFPHVLWLFIAVAAVADMPRRVLTPQGVPPVPQPALAAG